MQRQDLYQSLPRLVKLNLSQHGMTPKEIQVALGRYQARWPERVKEGDWFSDFSVFAIALHYQDPDSQKPLLPNRDWSPTNKTLDVLEGEGVSRQYALSRVPEFILYWRENGTPRTSYEATFIAYIRACREEEEGPRVLPQDWGPDEALMAELANKTDPPRLEEAILEFRIYWQDHGAKKTKAEWHSLFKAFVQSRFLGEDGVSQL